MHRDIHTTDTNIERNQHEAKTMSDAVRTPIPQPFAPTNLLQRDPTPTPTGTADEHLVRADHLGHTWLTESRYDISMRRWFKRGQPVCPLLAFVSPRVGSETNGE